MKVLNNPGEDHIKKPVCPLIKVYYDTKFKVNGETFVFICWGDHTWKVFSEGHTNRYSDIEFATMEDERIKLMEIFPDQEIVK